jgi:parallel beta-helix repeat protein
MFRLKNTTFIWERKLLMITLIACFLSLFVVANVSAATRIVPYDNSTIQGAVNAASPGDTIFIKNGTYNTPITLPIGGAFVKITKDNLTLIGESRDGVILVGRNNKSGVNSPDWIKGIQVMADNVTIKNLTVRGFKGGTGVENRGFGIVFDDFVGGIYQNGKVENVNLMSNGTALRAASNQNLTVAGSLIQNLVITGHGIGYGIQILLCDSATITGNKVTNGFDGIQINESDNVTIADNIVNGTMDQGMFVSLANSGTISSNDVSASSQVAIVLYQSSSLTLTENRIHDNDGLGVRISGDTTDIQLSCNTITSNAAGGIKVEDNITGSRFDLNNIYDNTGFGANNITGSSLNFKNTWWGCTDGPGNPGCNSVSANVDYTPWLLAEKDMFWKDYNGKDIGGYMPDIDQKQDFSNTKAGVDNDGDGDIDEDPCDGIDNDVDGEVDEDAATDCNYCAPTAAADSLWWLAKKHNLNLNLTDINGDENVDISDLVQELAWLMDTNGQRTQPQTPRKGTLPADQKNGIDLFLTSHEQLGDGNGDEDGICEPKKCSVSPVWCTTNPDCPGAETCTVVSQEYCVGDVLHVHKKDKPTFTWIEDEVKSCQNVKLDLGFWHVKAILSPTTGVDDDQDGKTDEEIADGKDNDTDGLIDEDIHGYGVVWERCGGHAVDVAGVDSNNSLIAISDPDADRAEAGFPGIVRGPNHVHTTGHNDTVSASHDIFKVAASPSPGGLFGMTDSYWQSSFLCERYELNNGEYRIVVVPFETEPPFQVSEVHTEIETAVVVSPKIFVVKPNGGETIRANSIYTIQWSAIPAAVKFDLKYSFNNGKTWKDIANGVIGTSLDWIVPPPPSEAKNQGLVKVIGYDASNDMIGEDTSNSTFTVEAVKVTSPDWFWVLKSSEEWTITWTVYGTSRPVDKTRLYFTKDGHTWIEIATIDGSDDQFYTWTVPSVGTKKTQCLVKVVLKDSSDVTLGKDISDDFFTIKP